MHENLEIPSFLLRDATTQEVARPERKPAQRRRASATADYITVHLQDEIPRIGSGLRRVTVAKLGRKWVSLKVPGKAKAIRVSRKLWDRVKVVA